MASVSTEHIEITDQMSGQPKIKGKRITVSMIQAWHDLQGYTVDRMVSEFDLTPAEVHAALAYYWDHREDIERQRRDEDAFVEDFFKGQPSVFERYEKRQIRRPGA